MTKYARRSLLKHVLIVLFFLTAIAVLIITAPGCASTEPGRGNKSGGAARAAADVAYVTGATNKNPATRPSEAATLDLIRGAVDVAGTFFPPIKPIANAAGMLAILLGGHQLGKRKERRKSNSIVKEIASDIHTFRDPTEAFTPATEKALIELGLHAIAKPIAPAQLSH